MATLVLETPEGVDLSREVAGPGSRAAAAILDVLAVVAVWASLLLLAMLLSDVPLVGAILSGVVQGGTVLFPIVYPAACGILMDGKSIGKQLLGLRVVGDEGYPASPLQHVLRALFWPLELVLALPVSVGLLLIASTARRQRLGDLIAGTVVVVDGRKAGVEEPYHTETWQDLPRRSVELSASRVADLDRRDFDLVRGLLVRRTLEPRSRRALLRRTAEHYRRRLDLGPVDDGGQLLKELYLYLRDRRRD